MRWLIFALIFLTICIIAVIICLVLYPDVGYMYYLLLAASAAAFVCTVYTMIKWYKTPQTIITKQGDTINFCGGVKIGLQLSCPMVNSYGYIMYKAVCQSVFAFYGWSVVAPKNAGAYVLSAVPFYKRSEFSAWNTTRC